MSNKINLGRVQGLSAYEVAVKNGFVGSELEWVNSLKGSKGDAFEYEDFTPEELAQLKGENGTTFTPSVSSEGVISWTNDGGETNPTPVNIKGESGVNGFSPIATVSRVSDGAVITITDSNGTTEAKVNDGSGDTASNPITITNGNIGLKYDDTLRLDSNGNLRVNMEPGANMMTYYDSNNVIRFEPEFSSLSNTYATKAELNYKQDLLATGNGVEINSSTISAMADGTTIGFNQSGELTVTGDYADASSLAPVATSGSYNDLTNKPTIPVLPTLATVATSGSYTDLSDKPTIPNYTAGTGITIDSNNVISSTGGGSVSDPIEFTSSVVDGEYTKATFGTNMIDITRLLEDGETGITKDYSTLTPGSLDLMNYDQAGGDERDVTINTWGIAYSITGSQTSTSSGEIVYDPAQLNNGEYEGRFRVVSPIILTDLRLEDSDGNLWTISVDNRGNLTTTQWEDTSLGE